MTRHLFTLSLGFGLLLICATQVFGQAQARQCGPRANVLMLLGERYGESRQSIGLGADNQVVEVYASTETGTWTITVTSPAGLTCLVASGQAYEALSDVSIPQGSAL